jgi:hypothetical protein
MQDICLLIHRMLLALGETHSKVQSATCHRTYLNRRFFSEELLPFSEYMYPSLPLLDNIKIQLGLQQGRREWAFYHVWELMRTDRTASFIQYTLYELVEFQTRVIRQGGWDLTKRSERCASMPKVAGSSPSSGSDSIFGSDLLLTARESST